MELKEQDTLDLKERVGHTAGKVWSQLSEGGPQTIAQLKKKLNGEGDLVNLAIGWLAREGKVDIVSEKKSFRVKLK
ncbi:MAG: winged helix-turn-helix domain-containing protein [Terriglobia bacterium]